MNNSSSPRVTIKMLYLYVVSLATLMMVVFSSVSVLNNLLKMFVFTKAGMYYSSYYSPSGCENMVAPPAPVVTSGAVATSTKLTPEQCDALAQADQEHQEKNRRASQQSSLVWSLSLLVVAAPLFYLHSRMIKKSVSA